ncbi:MULTISPECIES: TolC family protein [Olivibacter]|jgi:outer membrane protein TolC|uniref:Outer membrane efflux protein n=3 Tax=Sphingobacteriaceae TaxID=84566 RepID=F4C796_SPHS2|nr:MULTISPECIES: TolC family protein [unclassified Olivibacter]MCL4638959.1 TolC family protein [Olivibacter sp. UJ_SKK_5.1]MDM8175373.1 TolC family protein [Olivibacter sp. 47]MDX3913988.1 TolC family protein [Pseudosphingobacterium sp.]QEL02135.1 TolC family protein [Olivibacter sp. LS-1]
MKYTYLSLLVLLLTGFSAKAQDTAQVNNSISQNATLQECIDFALKNQASVQQALIDEEIGKRDIASALSGWFPQISANASYNYNVKIPTNVIGDQVIQFGQKHTSAVVLQADQKILDPSLLQASKAARYVKLQNAQNTENSRINITVAVSKAFYDVLTSEEQIKIIDENIARTKKQLADANARYETGLVDKTDYKRAQITLSNTEAERKRTVEMLKYKYAYLKELIGVDVNQPLDLSYDGKTMENEMLVDTTQLLQFERRIEFQQLLTQQRLQQINTQYNKWTFLPNLSAFYNYAWDWRTNNGLSSLYDVDYPRSVLGVTLSFPIFQGTKRIQEIRKSKLQEKRIDWDITNLRNQINTQHQQALATYKANLNDWKTAKENVELSKEVYNTIKLQYDEGIKTYLDLMTAETDLRTTQINYLNALYAVLSGKLDVQQALGNISYK